MIKKKIMTKLFFILLVFLFSVPQLLCSQTLWTKISERNIEKSLVRARATLPSSYQLFALDFTAFKQLLKNAPLENSLNAAELIISFPTSEGKVTSFKVVEAPIMEAELQQKFPALKSYSAISIDDSQITLRFSITDFGLHAMSLTNEKGAYFIDSYTNDSKNYMVYYKKDCKSTKEFECQTKTENKGKKQQKNTIQKSNNGLFRQYRMAMTTDAAYSQYHIDAAGVTNGTLAQKKSAVLSALIVSMTRINGVFERDLGVRMNLVANNDLILLIGPNAFEFTEANIMNENIIILNNTIGINNYDVGHLVTAIGNNIAAGSCICHFDKGAGTTGSGNPVGDPFDIDYLAHEIGHQFGAGHSFYSSCGDNASETTCVEPGSGSTIMAYAGICDPSVQNHSDAYFNIASIQEIEMVMNEPDNCSVNSPSSTTPIIAPLNNYKIPYGTAFVLKGNATGANPSSLTYCWEQIDVNFDYLNPQPQPPLITNTLGPNFRSLPPSSSPDRYLPNFKSVLAGNLKPKWEVIPSVARMLNFALTVRNNSLINGGQTQTATTQIEVANVGPFKITSPSQVNSAYSSGIQHNLTWDVAGTTSNGINTATVTISISTDNGLTFNTLVSNTPNDGNELIQFPSINSPYCRLMIKADSNIYYAVSCNFSIGCQITTTCTTYSDNQSIPIISDNNQTLYSTRTINVPTSGIVSDVNLSTLINHEFMSDFKIDISSPAHPNDFVMINYGLCWGLNGDLNLSFSDDGNDIDCTPSTTLQNVLPYEPLSVFNGQEQQGNWTLRVYDHVEPDEGVISNWGLEICSEVASLATTNPISEIGFTISPNPADDIVSIQLATKNNAPITLTIYDNLGRQLWNNEYINQSSIVEKINSSTFKSGLYLVSVKYGNEFISKKLIIN